MTSSGIILIDKPIGKTSFYLVHVLRKITGIRKIGHAGTLDPLATGVMVMLIGKNATRLTPKLIGHDKVYEMTILLGQQTNTLDTDGSIIQTSSIIPQKETIDATIASFQGTTQQIPPMFSAKKVAGKRLYELARRGEEIERKPINVTMKLTLLDYAYPYLKLRVYATSGSYMRTLADDIGKQLGCFGCVSALRRLQSGPFSIEECVLLENLNPQAFPVKPLDQCIPSLGL